MTTPEKIGRYEIKGELGRGGMATVYRAYDPSFEREVAIKVLPRELMHDPQFRDRFRREIKTIASLEHPAIVPVYDVGEEDGVPYFVMRYMPGGSLTQWIEKGKFSLEDAARIIERLSSALAYAHKVGLI
ncbi:MAG TPA: serine/threonine-protein kinase, partial [Anaerolineales bacterium]|nr:serine/threonine-protein kinase [Anaerolineales bacterium]